MDSLDTFRERFEALEQQTEQLRQQTHTLEAQTHTLARQAALVAGHRLWAGASGSGEPALAVGHSGGHAAQGGWANAWPPWRISLAP